MDGWISLHRKLLESDLWRCEPFTRGQAWVDLLLLANHADSFFYKRGNKIDVLRGQVGRSEVELADRWKWSRTKLRMFLKQLEKEQQIIQQKSSITLIVTIVNYDFYQQKEQQVGQQKDSRKTAERQQKNTYNNVNNENNENNENNNIIESKKFDFKNSLIELGIELKIIEDWLLVRKNKKASNTETSFNEIKKQIQLSGLTPTECIKIAVERDWKGFKSEWLKNLSNGKTGANNQIKQPGSSKSKSGELEEWILAKMETIGKPNDIAEISHGNLF